MKRRVFNLTLITTLNMVIIYVPFSVSILFYIKEHFEDSVGLYCYVLAGFVQPLLNLKRAGKRSCLCCQ